jgi:hypothetical protein
MLKRIRKLVPVVLAASFFVLSVSTAALADETLTTVSRPTPINAYGGRLAWSRFDPARNAYELVTRAPGGAVTVVPVKPRSVPFDVDLGPGKAGGTLAVYSRCRRDPPKRDPVIGNAIVQLPDWARGRGCDLYRFDFATGHERRIAGASSREASEFLPTVWKGEVAFARVYERRHGRAGQRPHLYLRSHGRSRPLLAGIRSRLRFCSGPRRRCRLKVEPGPTALDLAGRRLAFAWDSGDQGGAISNIYLETIRRRGISKNLLQRESSGDIQGAEIVSATIDSGKVVWGLTLFGDETGSSLRRYAIRNGARDQTPLPPPGFQDAFLRPVLGAAVSGREVFYLLSGPRPPNEPGCTPQTPCLAEPGCADTRPCQLRRAEDLVFTRLPKK